MRRARTVPYSRDFAPITVIIICFQILTNAYEGGEEELKGMGRKRRLGDGKESDGSGGRVRYAPRPLPTSPGSATALATSLSVTDVGLPLSSIHALCKRRD